MPLFLALLKDIFPKVQRTCQWHLPGTRRGVVPQAWLPLVGRIWCPSNTVYSLLCFSKVDGRLSPSAIYPYQTVWADDSSMYLASWSLIFRWTKGLQIWGWLVFLGARWQIHQRRSTRMSKTGPGSSSQSLDKWRERLFGIHIFFVWSSWFVFDPSVFLILQVFPSGGGRENLWCLGG